MAEENPELQAKLRELDHELEVCSCLMLEFGLLC